MDFVFVNLKRRLSIEKFYSVQILFGGKTTGATRGMEISQTVGEEGGKGN